MSFIYREGVPCFGRGREWILNPVCRAGFEVREFVGETRGLLREVGKAGS